MKIKGNPCEECIHKKVCGYYEVVKFLLGRIKNDLEKEIKPIMEPNTEPEIIVSFKCKHFMKE